jgi:hypothetical protein
VVTVGREEQTSSCVLDVRGRREPERLLRQLGGRRRRAPGGRRPRCVLENQGDLATRLGCREREVARSFLSVRDDVGEPCVERPPTRRRLSPGDRRSEQRMGESQTLTIELENPRVERPGESWLEAGAERGLNERDGRIGQRRDSARDLERNRAEAVDALVQKLVEVGGNREFLAGRERAASALEGGRDLEREEGVAARGFPDPDQRRPREPRIEAGS